MRRVSYSLMVSLLLVFCILTSITVPAFGWAATSDWGKDATPKTDYTPLEDSEFFDLSAQEFFDAFNKMYSLNGSGTTLVKEGAKCNVSIRGEVMNIYVQFMDVTEQHHRFQTESGLGREVWNKLKIYIATDDKSLDSKYFDSFQKWLELSAPVLGLNFDINAFSENAINIGSEKYPEYEYIDEGIKYSAFYYDDSAAYLEPTTTYAISIELLQK